MAFSIYILPGFPPYLIGLSSLEVGVAGQTELVCQEPGDQNKDVICEVLAGSYLAMAMEVQMTSPSNLMVGSWPYGSLGFTLLNWSAVSLWSI